MLSDLDRNVLLGEAVWVLSVIKKAGATEIAVAAQADTEKLRRKN